MDHNEQEASGSLYSLSVEGPCQTIVKRYSHLERHRLVARLQDHVFYRYTYEGREGFDYDIETGQIVNPRVIIHFADTFGWPDGMTSD